MFSMPQYKDPISLIPGGCPQFLDFAGSISLCENIKYSFEEIQDKSVKGESKVRLHVYRKNADGELVDELDPGKRGQGYGYDLNALKTIKPWLGQWIPIPFLRTREQSWPDSDECRFEYGPSNWARCRLVKNEENPEELRLVIVFDMQVEKRTDENYAALSHDDVDTHAHFRLAWRFRDNAWFMDLPWVEEWLREIFTSWKKSHGSRRTDDERLFEHLASYLVYLAVIKNISKNCEVYVIKPDGSGCVDVDLVLDIGNSRTTGILVETHTQSATNLNDSYLLQLRDMDKPEKIYTDPFETRIEFCEASFGNEALSLRSGRRTPAFLWPSPIRIGPEAGRLSTRSRCEKGTTGMSSPKRYLWDERDWKRTWRFNTGNEKAPYVTRGTLAQLVNSSGTPLCCMNDPGFVKNRNFRNQEKESALESLFTRSSLMMFLLIEIIHQALLTINLPGQRLRREAPAEPRRLRQVIFTVPGGMPVAEQKIYRRWARWGVHVLWEALGWEQYYVGRQKRLSHNGPTDYRTSPIVRCDWDEATCTQLVYIYNEISRKFQGDAQLFCELVGREREFDGKSAPSVRVATIDIGGGTTDLSITTFELASDAGSTPRMSPHPDFHDGFSLAGDDILRAIIAEYVLDSIGSAMEEAGVGDMRTALASLFGKDTMDSSKEMLNQRIQFIRQLAVPCALCLLSMYEKTNLNRDNEIINLRIGDCFAFCTDEEIENDNKKSVSASVPKEQVPMPGKKVLDYIREYVAANGNTDDFNVLDVTIRVSVRRINDTVSSTLKEVLANLCEVINRYDCDELILTGRPSRWPGIVETIYSLLPLPPGKIHPMSEYRVGGWYPFSDALGNITDPKTTVVVGAILCALAEGQLEGFSFDPSNLGLVSTARYIGEMEINGQIKKDKVWFCVDPQKGEVSPKKAEISFGGPLSVGFRQLPQERWTTTRFYFLEFVNDDVRREYSRFLPFTVKMAFELPEKEDDDNKGAAARDEGEFFIEEITGKNGETPSGKILEMRLQTLPRNEGFWMDTGIVLCE